MKDEKKYKNASGRKIEAGEFVYIVGNDMYAATDGELLGIATHSSGSRWKRFKHALKRLIGRVNFRLKRSKSYSVDMTYEGDEP